MNEPDEDVIAYLEHLLDQAERGMIDSIACVASHGGMVRDMGAEVQVGSKSEIARGLAMLLEDFEVSGDD